MTGNDGQAGLNPGERPTLKTIARLSGLAVTTVSRALSDAPDISTKTKVRVREIAAQIGYRRDRTALRLRTGKTNVIALVLSTQHDMMNHTARLITSIAASLRGTSYHLIITPYFPDEDPMQPVRYIVETQSADGVILNQTQPDDPRVAYLLDHNMPVATHGRTNMIARHPFFDYDNEAFGRICVQRLGPRGRHKLLVVLPPMDQNYAQDMWNGIHSACAETDQITCLPIAGATSDSPSSEITGAIRSHLQTDPDIDGIICASTTGAMAAVAAVEESGRTVGHDVDVIGKEAAPFLHAFRPQILTVEEDVAKAGRYLGRALLHAIDHPEDPPMHELEVPVLS